MGDRIKSLREEFQLKKNQFSKEVGLSQHVITAYERGLSKPGFEFFLSVIEKFNADPYYLLTGNGKMFINEREEGAAYDNVLELVEDDENKSLYEEFLGNFRMSKWLRFKVLPFFHGLKISEGDMLTKDIEYTKKKLTKS